MTKKLLSLAAAALLMTGAAAQSIEFDQSDIQYWVGTGSNSAVVVIGWDNCTSGNNFALAWGVHWNGSVTAVNMLDTIATYDSRVQYNISSGFVTSIGYNDGTLIATPGSGSYWCYGVNGGFADAYSIQPIVDGDLMEISSSCYFSLTSATAATDPNGPAPSDTTVTPTNPVDATIAFSDILYWVGTGTDSAAFIVNYAQPDTAFAWGFLFNGTTTAQAMIDSIAAADPRFWYTGSPSMGGDVHFITDAGDTLGLSPAGALGYNFWWTNLNGRSAGAGIGATLHNGDVFKYGDLNSAIGWDPMGTYFMEEAWLTAPTPVAPPATSDTPSDTTAPVEATIAASDILYWVGHGSNQAVLAVNWADTALAWGYRFDGTATVADMMDAIAAADPRFSYVGSTGYLSDILYIDTAAGMTDTLRGSSWWGSTNNGVMDAGMGQALTNGDFEKWADPAAGVVVDSTYWEGYGWGYTYVYPMAITPVSVPDTATTPDDPVIPDHGPFCGPAGSEGSNAIAGNSDLFVAWATGITLQRGPDNIAVPNSPLATYGDDTMALGPVVMTDNLKVVSLGDGGMATLTFAQPITNGDGPDFAVFENGFDDYFLELAFVEVSSDGNRFVRFPATSLTQTETQATRLDPTFINNLAGKYRMGYGTPFDLEELRDSTGINIDSITHVRIIDVVGSIDPQYATYDAFGHIVNDPWPTAGYGSSGFDLDAVGVIHQLDPQQSIADALQVVSALWPNPTADVIHISLDRASEATLYDLTGRHVNTYTLAAGSNTLNLSDLNAGVYMLRVEGTACKIVKK